MEKQRDRTVLIGALGVLVATGSLVWTILWNLRNERSGACVLELIQEGGMPVDAFVVGPHGESRRTDPRGIAEIPCEWEGGSVSVREPSKYREIQAVLVSWTRGRQRVAVAR